MIVTCNACESSFRVDDRLIKDSGSKVRCSKCHSVFVVYPEIPDSDTAGEEANSELEMEEDLGAELDAEQEYDDLGKAATSDELPDLEDMMDFDDSQTEAAETLEEDAAEQELDFDLDLDTDEDALSAEEPVLEEDEEELGLDLELESLEDEEEVETPHAAKAESDLPDLEPDLDLDDLDRVEETDSDLEGTQAELSGEMGAEKTLPSATAEVSATHDTDELDLADLEDLVGSDDELQAEDMIAEASDDADLDLKDLDEALETEEESASEELDFDLQSEPEALEPAMESAADMEGTDELDLSELDGIMESDEAAEAAAIDEDLELDFEVDGEASKEAPAESAAGSDELEMPEIEQMLESDETPASAVEEDLDLEMDFEGTAGLTSEAQASPDNAEFLDIEKMLEENREKPAAGAKKAEEPVELDLEAVLDEAAQSAEPELELDLDLGDDALEIESPVAGPESGEADLDFKLLDSDEETLQFGATQASATVIDEIPPAGIGAGASSDDFSTDEFAEASELGGQTDVLESMGAAVAAPVRRRKTRKSLFAVVALLLLCLIGYVVTQNLGIQIPYVSDIKIPYLSDVKIPYLSGLVKSESQDLAGNLKITPLGATITHKFVQNNAAGDIFVIQGQVRNEYDHPRSYIKITGKLYVKGNALAKTTTVYCGNVLSDSDLANMDMLAINRHLQNRFGDNRSNIKINTGKTIPFSIVFNQLPPDLDEYTVEVAGSSS